MHPKAVKFLLIYAVQKKQLRYAEKSVILLNGKLGILYVLSCCLKRMSLRDQFANWSWQSVPFLRYVCYELLCLHS